MNVIKRRELFASIVNGNIGKPCPCCLERNAFEEEGLSESLKESARAFRKVFGVPVINKHSVIAFRLVPVPVGIAKRGEGFFYLLPNLVPSCSPECRDAYQAMWLYHPKRVAFIEELLVFQNGGKKFVITNKRIK